MLDAEFGVVRYLLDIPGIAVNACTVKGATSLLLAVEVRAGLIASRCVPDGV
jgi:hypothetical protein